MISDLESGSKDKIKNYLKLNFIYVLTGITCISSIMINPILIIINNVNDLYYDASLTIIVILTTIYLLIISYRNSILCIIIKMSISTNNSYDDIWNYIYEYEEFMENEGHIYVRKILSFICILIVTIMLVALIAFHYSITTVILAIPIIDSFLCSFLTSVSFNYYFKRCLCYSTSILL